MVTIKDVAEAAGVSTITASRALSREQRSKVKAQTRARVLSVAEHLGYQPNLAARALKAQRTFQYGLVVPYVHRSFLPDVLQGIQDVAMANDYSCLLYLTTYQRDIEVKVFSSLISKGVDGVIWLPGPTPVQETIAILGDTPIVQLLYKELSEAPAVLVDQELGAYLATQHLLSLGHTRISSLMVPDRHGRQRLNGFQAAMINAGLTPTATWEVPDARWQTAYSVVQQIIPSLNETTALVCYSDNVAAAAMRALKQNGFSIPADISIVGFDDTEMSRNLDPPLTTISIPKAEAGQQAMQLLLQMIADNAHTDQVLQPSLLVRSSSAPPASKA